MRETKRGSSCEYKENFSRDVSYLLSLLYDIQYIITVKIKNQCTLDQGVRWFRGFS